MSGQLTQIHEDLIGIGTMLGIIAGLLGGMLLIMIFRR